LTHFCSSCIVFHNVTFAFASEGGLQLSGFCFCFNIRLVLLLFFFYVFCSVTYILVCFLYIINQSVVIMHWMKGGSCTLVHINCKFCNILLLNTQDIHNLYTYLVGSRIAVGIVSWRSGDRIPVGARFSAPLQTGPGAHPASYAMVTGSFLGVKRPGCGVNHPPPSSAEVKERVEL
jgi:hypothetical protein